MKSLKKILFLFSLSLLSQLYFSCNKTQIAKETLYPQRIISLSPAGTEILFAIGAESQIAAVSDFSDYPPQAMDLPKAGGFDGNSISLERLLSFNPDFLYLSDGMHNFLIEKLNEFKIPFYLSKADSFENLKQEILEIGEITGHGGQAKSLVSEMCSKLPSEKTEESNLPQTVYYEIWNEPYMSAGKLSFINDVIQLAGCNNIFSDISEAYPVVSEESIIARQPEIILIPESSMNTVESVKNRNGWDSIPAVKNNKIFVVDDNLYSRPGPRIIDAICELSQF